jgi:hypothetical protein
MGNHNQQLIQACPVPVNTDNTEHHFAHTWLVMMIMGTPSRHALAMPASLSFAVASQSDRHMALRAGPRHRVGGYNSSVRWAIKLAIETFSALDNTDNIFARTWLVMMIMGTPSRHAHTQLNYCALSDCAVSFLGAILRSPCVVHAI